MATIIHIDNCSSMSLHLACKNQNLELVKILLENGENPNAIDDEMFTPLHRACTSKSDVTVTIIELLLKHNANIEAAENECRWTPLFTACREGNDVAVKCLLENHANPNTMDLLGYTPLQSTAFVNRNGTCISLIQLLLQYHANIEARGLISRTPLLLACYNCNYIAAKYLLDNHADPFAVDNNRSTSLHLVSTANTFNSSTKNMTVPLIELLLQHHANIEAVDNMNKTPLMIACTSANHDAVKCLLDHHANVEAVDELGTTPLMLACWECNYDTIKCLLDHHANIEAVDEQGTTPLIAASRNGNNNAIKCLLDHHANIEAVDEQGTTPLIAACRNRNNDAIKCLVDHHANIEAVDREGKTPLMIAFNDDNHVAIKYLLEHRANIETVDSTVWTPFMVACNNNHHNAIKPLLDFEEYRKFKILHYYVSNCSRTPLHFACKNNDLELVKILLENGENPNAIDDEMFTPLHRACTSKSDVTVTIIELLLKHNANIEAAENECGWTPLFIACIHNNDVAVKCLLENLAKPNANDRMGYTPLHWICFCNSDDIALSIAQFLLQNHANIEARSYNGRTPFLMACYNSNYVTAKFFLDNHANIFAIDNDGFTSLHFVCDRKNDMTVTLIELLIQHYANIEAVNKKGWTPLMVASNRGNCDAIRCLFNHYANVNHSDKNNSTALHIAVERQSVKTTECLIECNADINLLDKENQTPFEKAVKMWSLDESCSRYIRDILKFEVVKLKVAGLKIHDHNLNILHQHEEDICLTKPSLTAEIERMKKKKILNNEITLYNVLEKNISFLCQFVTDEGIQQQLNEKYLNKDFQLYINIVQNRFRETIIQYTRNDLINQAIEYFRFNINQQLPNEILDCIFASLSISELKCFGKSFQDALG
ncbi:ankyrin-1-like [Chelonus insularis]|uniref:ankyrin-1-like n=1 Tax=Chelonus insularis TaxID=460826 RepID=UPI00158BAB24|nr:ankyrin-1-like [Chelonus insularis]